jgi:hypothetical protein
MGDKLQIVPITQGEANAFVKQYHRHHGEVVGSIFQIACSAVFDACDIETRMERKIYEIVGVAIVGRPVASELDNTWTAEVSRLCTNGTKNACSMLYSAAWRIAKNMGYRGMTTYILKEEQGASLRASGWRFMYESKGGSWNSPSRPRIDKHPTGPKNLYAIGIIEGKRGIEKRPRFKKPRPQYSNLLFNELPNNIHQSK